MELNTANNISVSDEKWTINYDYDTEHYRCIMIIITPKFVSLSSSGSVLSGQLLEFSNSILCSWPFLFQQDMHKSKSWTYNSESIENVGDTSQIMSGALIQHCKVALVYSESMGQRGTLCRALSSHPVFLVQISVNRTEQTKRNTFDSQQ